MTEMTWAVMLLGGLLGVSLSVGLAINKNLLRILTELQKRNYIEDLTNRVIMTTQTPKHSSPTKTTPHCEISNQPGESEQQSSTP